MYEYIYLRLTHSNWLVVSNIFVFVHLPLKYLINNGTFFDMRLTFALFGKWSIEWKILHTTWKLSEHGPATSDDRIFLHWINAKHYKLRLWITACEIMNTIYAKVYWVNFTLCNLCEYHQLAHHDSRVYAEHTRLENITQRSKCKWKWKCQKKPEWWFHLLGLKTPTNLYGVAQLFYHWLHAKVSICQVAKM